MIDRRHLLTASLVTAASGALVRSGAGAAALPAVAARSGESPEVAVVEARVRRIWERFAAQDPQGMLALIHPDATIWDVFQPDLVTRHDMEGYVQRDYAQSAARGKLTYSMENMVTSVWGDAAICRFYLQFDYEPPNPTAGRSRNTCVLRRFPRDGWLVVHVHEGQVPAGIPPIGR